MDYKDGDTITVNGKPCRIEAGALVPVVSKGPLGGELKRLADLKEGELFIVRGYVWDHNRCGPDEFKTKVVVGSDDFMSFYDDLPQNVEVETNIPPRPTFTPMTAGEAAKVSGIAGRWVAVKVGKNDKSKVPLGVAITENGHSWLAYNAEILLIEGVDLP